MENLERVVSGYDGVLSDQDGVLLDVIGAYAGAPDARRRLAESHKSIIILSNSGKRSEPNNKRLEGFGFERTSFRMVLSSGEVAYRMLSDDLDGGRMVEGRVFLHAREDETSAVDGLPVKLVDNPAEAERILLTGSRGDRLTLAYYETLLAPAAKRAVPCICSNPDKVMLTPTGRHFGAGAIAELYEQLGGPVTWIGKPYQEIYRAALSEMNGMEAGRIVCIGDSLEHDSAGGAGARLATVLGPTRIWRLYPLDAADE